MREVLNLAPPRAMCNGSVFRFHVIGVASRGSRRAWAWWWLLARGMSQPRRPALPCCCRAWPTSSLRSARPSASTGECGVSSRCRCCRALLPPSVADAFEVVWRGSSARGCFGGGLDAARCFCEARLLVSSRFACRLGSLPRWVSYVAVDVFGTILDTVCTRILPRSMSPSRSVMLMS